jgi:hypothetical protein
MQMPNFTFSTMIDFSLVQFPLVSHLVLQSYSSYGIERAVNLSKYPC